MSQPYTRVRAPCPNCVLGKKSVFTLVPSENRTRATSVNIVQINMGRVKHHYCFDTCSGIFIYIKVVQKRYVTLCFKVISFPQACKTIFAPDEEKISNVSVLQKYLSSKLLYTQSKNAIHLLRSRRV